MKNLQHRASYKNVTFFSVLCILILNSCAASRLQNVQLSIRQQDWQKAQHDLEESIQHNPRDGEALLLLAEVYGELDMAEKMMTTILTLRKLSPKYEEPTTFLIKKYWLQNFDFGVKQFNVKAYDEALASFYRAVIIDSSNKYSAQKYADALFMTGRYYDSEKIYGQLLQKKTENIVLMNNLSEIFFLEKQYQKAIRLCSEILARDDQQINALMRRAYSYNALGQMKNAEQDYRLLAEKKPSERILTDFGLMYFRNHKYPKAVKQFEAALDFSQSPLQLFHYLGECNWKMKNYPVMISWYQKVVEMNPNDLVGWKNLAVSYEALGKRQLLSEARLQINKIIRTN